MKKILIYGAGQGGRHFCEEILKASEPYKVVAFIDKYSGCDTIELKDFGERYPIIRPEER